MNKNRGDLMSYYYVQSIRTDNKAEKINLWEKGAQNDEVECMYELANLYSDNSPENRYYSLEKSRTYAKMAAQKGDARGMFILSGVLKNLGEQENDRKKIVASINWLVEAGKKGYEPALMSLEKNFFVDKETRQKICSIMEPAVFEIRDKPDKDKRDYYHLGLFYVYNIVFDTDFAKAEELFKKARGYNFADEILSRKCYNYAGLMEGKTNADYLNNKTVLPSSEDKNKTTLMEITKEGANINIQQLYDFASEENAVLSSGNTQKQFVSTNAISTVHNNSNGSNINTMQPEKSAVVTFVLALLFGHVGFHNFYLGYIKEGIIQFIISAVLCQTIVVPIIVWIFALIKGIRALTGKITDAKGRPLYGIGE